MSIRRAYNKWAEQYDSNINKTRDLEGQALRFVLKDLPFDDCLEIGCGTGKNTLWLLEKARHITAVDQSEEMMARAREKTGTGRVDYVLADILQPWSFRSRLYDLVSFSLVLEHINDLGHVFSEAAASLKPGGYMYIGELHPFKQYGGTKARFESEEGTQVLECYNHHISEFVQSARRNGMDLIDLNEFFDGNDQTLVPRILTLLVRKKI
ncbi:class I SAM-dependent methyltransferase [Flavihumibacter solisilvae]|uniref:Methyltransferase type 11 n=1 Tax=Flavihumibacter solisilvae TaxID=1349421 RepID=A0A0C1LD13_9BACT|nr:class I SAM-dependent methyltransferase [Flavihumibacter solisilvae]KIC93403.1 methyltransferase type 11 [Flavihumibacter solisilvae]